MIVDDIESEFEQLKVKPHTIHVAPKIFRKLIVEASSINPAKYASSAIELVQDFGLPDKWRF